MANRHLLSTSKTEDFKAWLSRHGWTIQAPKGFYEVIRAEKDGRVLIAYQRLGEHQHLSLNDKDERIVRAFLND